MATATKSPPVHTVRLGRVKVNVWANETQYGVRHSLTLRIGYKDGDEWKETQSIGRDYGYQAARAIQLATDWIFEHGKDDSDAGGEGN